MIAWSSVVVGLMLSGLLPGDSAQVKQPPALDGKCAVCLNGMGKLVDGVREHSSIFDGRMYLFPSDEHKKMFDRDPAKYVPALGGDCVVCWVKMGTRVAGSTAFKDVHDGRLFLFPGQEQLDEFKRDPHRYTSADLPLGNSCPVCLVDASKIVAGSERIAVVHDGMTYRFPGDEQKRLFEADPAKYTPALGGLCTVCFVDGKKAVAGKAEFHAVHEGRLFLFPGKEQLAVFEKSPAKYAVADIVDGGECVVCKADGHDGVAGKSSLAVDFGSRRYLFATPEARDSFVADPMKFQSK